MNKTRNEERYFSILRIGAFGVSSFLWLLSVLWSADGFGIKLEDWKVAGYGLALCVTIIQLVFNRGTMNPTLYFGGLAAYIYGIATNIIGLISIIGISFSDWNSDPIDKFFSIALIFALAFVVEVLPESLLLWALNPEQGSPGDFITSLFGGSGYKRKSVKKVSDMMPPEIRDMSRQNVNDSQSDSQSPTKRDVLDMTPQELSKKYKVSERTAYRWKERAIGQKR